MKHILLFPFLLLISCTNAQDETALFKDALSAVFESLPTELEIMDASVCSKFAIGLDEDLIREVLNNYHKETLDRLEIDIDQAISTWEKYKGNDLSVYVDEKYLPLLIPEDTMIDWDTTISFSAPFFTNGKNYFFIYLVIESKNEKKENRSHSYFLFGKENESWIWMMGTSKYKVN